VLRSARSPKARIQWLVVAGVVGLVSGWLLGQLGVVPVVKRIWTPSWVLFSGGWCFLLTAAFYAIIDVRRYKRWAFPLVVIGVNSIAAYLIAHLFEAFILKNLTTHLGAAPFKVFGAAYQPLTLGLTALVVMWLMLYWMYRRKLYLKI
jgi:predicted acyltransferase